jgi:predicted ribosome quality control (RQC) complex YloA/Tae2 family protein
MDGTRGRAVLRLKGSMMYLDAFTISALADEFNEKITGGRVQDVLDVDGTGFGLEVYSHHWRHYLYMSADKHSPRIYLVPDKLRRGLHQPTQLGLLFRRYVEGGIITAVRQPAWERILFIDLEHPAEGALQIVIEPMERRSNILLVRDGIVLDCVHRIGPGENSYRLSLPNHAYQLPPPLLGRLDPFTLTRSDLTLLMDQADVSGEKLARVLPRHILGFSPLVAREVVYRASGDVDTPVSRVDVDRLYDALREMLEPLQTRSWQAGHAEADGEIVAYSVYPLRQFPEWQPDTSISAALVTYYGAAVGEDAYNAAKKPVADALNEAQARIRARLESLERGLKEQSEMQYLQQSGELILAYQYSIKAGQTELKAVYDADKPELVIRLDPRQTPLENAQHYFDQYNRAKRAREHVPELIDATRTELAYLDQLQQDLHIAANWPEIDEVIQALQALGVALIRSKVKRSGGSAKTAPLRVVHDGYVLWIGRNSRQNEQVTFRNARADDLWLHARDVPGAHVVIRNDGRRIPESLIESAAAIAAYYSSRQLEIRVPVDVTRCKYVKAIKGAGPGMVTYRNENTLVVAPRSEEVLKHG